MFDLLRLAAENRLGGGCPSPDMSTAILCKGKVALARDRKALVLASTEGQMGPVGAPRQMHRLFGPLGNWGHKDALVATEEDAEWKEPATARYEWEAFSAFREAGRILKRDAPQ